ncbi:MAG: choice-of-anchor tandem repeat GloVer-containing protein [Bryobacteraceae bacterium]|jgi:uncharacterized repeat protein (TIGR03803 family)
MRIASAVSLVLAGWNLALAQNYSVIPLHNFAGKDGQDPVALLQTSDGSFFGAAALGGAGYGTVFHLTTAGQLTTLHQFAGTDGASPNSLILAKDQTLYGTTLGGNTACPSGCGTVFHIDAQGHFSTLYAFSGPDGQYPANLLQGLDGNLYGTTGAGGVCCSQPPAVTVFKLTKAGDISTLYTFCSAPDCFYGSQFVGLVQVPSGDFFGLTNSGVGQFSGSGEFIQITPSGVGTDIWNILPSVVQNPGNLVVGGDGAFYFTMGLDPYGSGRVLRLDTQGQLSVLHGFDYTDGDPPYTLRAGRDGNVYGIAASGGSENLGDVFEVSVPSGFSFLYTLTGGQEGAAPTSVLLGSDGNLYGTTAGGGFPAGPCVNCGTVFELQKLGPQSPTIANFVPNSSPAGAQVTLTGANFTGATSVQFGKAPATFTVVSDTQITAQVPSGASTYPLTVTTPNGSALSIQPFEIGPPLSTIYTFCPASPSPFPYCPDAVNPNSLIRGADGNYYGTTDWSIPNSSAFRVTPRGALTTLAAPLYYPNRLFQASNGNIYGTSQQGGYFGAPTACNSDPEGAYGCGAIFQFTPSGTYSQLYAFRAHDDGEIPIAGVVEGSDGAIYGTTSAAGANGQGTIYRLSNAGLQTLYSFSGADGSAPSILVAAKNGTFYGITESGGSGGKGTVFAFNASGTLTTLYNFTGQADGGTPSSLILTTDGNLYGATSAGGSAGGGIVFQLTPGGALTTLYNFSASTSGSGPANLVAGSGRLFGTTGGGEFGGGTIFELTLTGELRTLYAFYYSATASFGGYGPTALVIALDGSFYGTTAAGGALACQYGQGCGTVFHLTGVQ